MPRKQSGGNASNDVALDRYGIYRVPTLDRADHCPESLLKTFQLVCNSKNLQKTHFMALREKKDTGCEFDTRAAHDYNMTLGQRADELAGSCCDPDRMDWPEIKWVQVLSRVFLSFDRQEEEKLDAKHPFHHCFACRRHFPPESRPIINMSNTQRSRAMQKNVPNPGDLLRQDFELCESRDQHFNLPNFDISQQLQYRDDDGDINGSNSKQIPDATIGLYTYDLKRPPWVEREDLINNDRVKLFDKMVLADCLKHFGLEGPYWKGSAKYGTAAHAMFGFGLWEAKKATAENHSKTFCQTARKLATLLRWQRRIFDEARCKDACPLAWFFSSVGSSWEICACYEKKNPHGQGYLYPTVVLWSGRSEDSDGALQLLYIVDIIRFWAEYTYKPTIGTCLSRLQAIKAGESPVPFEDTLWKSQITLNEANTPWFFNRRSSYEARSASPAGNEHLEVSLRERSSNRRSSDQPPLCRTPVLTSQQSPQRRYQRDTTPVGKRYIIPEIDSYNWILDRDPGYGDLLLIRINENGTTRRPIVFFDSFGWTSDWDDPEFISILADEKKRHHSDVLPRFTVDRRGRDYLWQCGRSKFNLIRHDSQFCAILPLDRAEYNRQRPQSKECQLFEPLESLLDLPVLLADIDRAYEQWCLCNCPWNKYSPPMIRCDNAKCNLGWYHNKCAGLDETDEREHWLCKTCRKIPKKDRIDTEDLNIEYDGIFEASSYRIQRTRTLCRAWNKHAWPKAKAVRREFQKVTLNLDIVMSAAHIIHRKGVQRDSETPRYWVISKDKPYKLVVAGPREKQLVYHKKVAKEDDEDGSGNTDEDDTYFSDEAVNSIDDALSGMSLGQARTDRA